MLINYDFADLETFLAVMDTGSFHLAAEQIHLSQPAVTRRIRKLEAALDSQLFERTTRQVKPTLAAKRLYARAEALLADAEETALAMRDETLRYAHQRNAVVTVAAVPTVIACWLAPALAVYRVEGHRARVRLLDLAANEVAEAVAQGEADFGLCAMPAQEPGTRFQPLFDDPLMAVVPAGHPLAESSSLSWAALAGHELILAARGTGNRLLIDDAMARARMEVAWSYEARRTTTALDLVRAGLGIAVLPRTALGRAGADGVCVRPISGPDILRPMGVLTRTGVTLQSAAEQLLAHVISGAERVAPAIRHVAPEPPD
ncbi:MAG: LysR family transcriptional regulator [Rhodobacteraceae bacterium]|nr:LysR family transcriptional regulator [Paracoccaceae bacterium]